MTDEERQLHKQLWLEENWMPGKLHGFPDCCVKEFCDLPPAVMMQSKPTANDILKYQASCLNGKFTGFIPCLDHARQILAGKTTLQSLITNRDPFLPPFQPGVNEGFYGPDIDIPPGTKINIEE